MKKLRPILVGVVVLVCIAFVSRVHGEGVQDQRNELSTARAPLPKGRNLLGDMLVSPDRRLGMFDIDLGLPAGGSRLSVQTNYMMMNILSRAISAESVIVSGGQCAIVLAAASYPLIQAYMYMPEASAPRDQARRICLDVFRRILSAIENNDTAISKAIDDLKSREARALGSSASPRQRSWAALSEAVRRIYDEDSTVHALLSIRDAQHATITVAQFRQWMETVRRPGRMRLLTDDPELDAERDTFERDINAWHEMPTPKKSKDLIEVNGFGPVDIRAAVLVAVKQPPDGIVRNDVVKKYCREKWNAKVDPADKTYPGCHFESVFHQEVWIQFYYLAEDGADETLRRLATHIARDSDVLALAAAKSDGGRSGHPYLVFFGD